MSSTPANLRVVGCGSPGIIACRTRTTHGPGTSISILSMKVSVLSSGRTEGLRVASQVSSCPTDIDPDGVTNVLDLIDLLLCFGQPAVPGCEVEDINGDGETNYLDLILLLDAFGTTCP